MTKVKNALLQYVLFKEHTVQLSMHIIQFSEPNITKTMKLSTRFSPRNICTKTWLTPVHEIVYFVAYVPSVAQVERHSEFPLNV